MRVLIIDDDHQSSVFIKRGLEAHAFAVDIASTPEKGLSLVYEHPYDTLLLDYYFSSMPKMRGLEIAREVRKKRRSLPIIVISVENSAEVEIEMLTLCDDYLSKPFLIKVLLARIRALLRREKVLHEEILEESEVTLDPSHLVVTRRGTNIDLVNKEFALLEFLMRNAGVVLTRQEILEHVWDANADPFTNTVEVHIRNLRKKLRTGGKEELIETVKNRGYRFKGEMRDRRSAL